MSQEQAHHHRNPYSNKDKARRLKRKANYYAILNGELFKKGLTTPILKCLISQQVNYIMRELHEGICGQRGKLGPLPKAQEAVKYLLVAIDYFTKWIEARPLREIMTIEVEKFT